MKMDFVPPEMPREAVILKKCLLAAGRVLAKYFTRTGYRLKGTSDLLTKADIESQGLILGIIKKNFPGHDYFAEENQRHSTGARYLWVVDPLDGTTNYAHGFPMACVSIGLLKDGKPFTGGIYDPFRDELFLAVKGGGAALNGKKITVSAVRRIEDSLLATGFPYDKTERADYYCRFYADFVRLSHDVRRPGSCALDMAWLAAGRTDGFWSFKLSPWDVAAGLLLVEEAGGKVTDFAGRSWCAIDSYGAQTLATNGKIHGRMLRIIRKNLVKKDSRSKRVLV
ncbi:MAG: inositol monophosphatase [Elusimicrobia bacterium]|nr:inositol monophosphatase [Candidatus Obscuribacterium magneticum]